MIFSILLEILFLFIFLSGSFFIIFPTIYLFEVKDLTSLVCCSTKSTVAGTFRGVGIVIFLQKIVRRNLIHNQLGDHQYPDIPL